MEKAGDSVSMEKLMVEVILGGMSSEREVSLNRALKGYRIGGAEVEYQHGIVLQTEVHMVGGEPL